MSENLRHWIKDTVERSVFTFVEAFLGLLIVDMSGAMGDNLSLGVVQHAAVSGVVAAFAVVKAAVASYRQGMSPASFVSDPNT